LFSLPPCYVRTRLLRIVAGGAAGQIFIDVITTVGLLRNGWSGKDDERSSTAPRHHPARSILPQKWSSTPGIHYPLMLVAHRIIVDML
jgi:hypothetical protein